MNELLTVRQTAQRLKFSPATIRRWVKDRKLDHVKFNERGIRIPRESVDHLLKTKIDKMEVAR